MRCWLRPLLIAIALACRLEATLRDRLRSAAPARILIVAVRRSKVIAKLFIARLSPPAALAVFAIPATALIPLKLVVLWLLAGGAWFSALVMFLVVKLLAVGMTMFTFGLCRAKLLQLTWFRRLYEWIQAVRSFAHRLVARARSELPPSGRLLRLVRRIRKTMRRPQPAVTFGRRPLNPSPDMQVMPGIGRKKPDRH